MAKMQEQESKTKSFNIRLDNELTQLIIKEKRKEGRNYTYIVERALREYFKKAK